MNNSSGLFAGIDFDKEELFQSEIVEKPFEDIDSQNRYLQMFFQ
jgi:hypothetical protein